MSKLKEAAIAIAVAGILMSGMFALIGANQRSGTHAEFENVQQEAQTAPIEKENELWNKWAKMEPDWSSVK